MSRERKFREEIKVETVGGALQEEFNEAKSEIYKAWHEFESDRITSAQRTAKIREVYREHPDVADEFEELTEEVSGGEFLTVGQLIAKEAKDAVIEERNKARIVREEASHRSAGQKRYERRKLAQDRRGTNPRDIH
ncbi:hypothetical protein HYZ78_02275 [Candidatus Microgenomates bacterium]|nr:hypothetical protein [Candidatus Microgenomates bacterium]